MTSVLVECGFMSNQGEYEKLINSKNQARIATGIADALAATIKATATGYVESTPAEPADPAAEPADPAAEPPDPATEPTDPAAEPDPIATEPDPIPAGDESSAANPTANDIDEPGDDSVEGVFLADETLTLAVGQVYLLDCVVEPLTAQNKAVTWRSGNTSVATVSADGTVTALAEGTVKITVATADGGFEDTCVVTVVAAAAANEGDFSNQYTDTGESEIEPDPVVY
jgi:uncharacterized protein YjdB